MALQHVLLAGHADFPLWPSTAHLLPSALLLPMVCFLLLPMLVLCGLFCLVLHEVCLRLSHLESQLELWSLVIVFDLGCLCLLWAALPVSVSAGLEAVS